jgi:Domain of unknown function (DUF5658)
MLRVSQLQYKTNINKLENPAKWIIALCIIDIITTIIGLKLGAKEVNQLVLLLGITGFLTIKAIVTIVLVVIVVLRNKGKRIEGKNIFTRPINNKWLWIGAVIMGLIVINNLVTIGIQLVK